MFMNISKDYAVQMREITKIFGVSRALDKINFDVKQGTIHALLGENGAGKSTLMNVLYGLYPADQGDIYLYGKKANIKGPSVAIKHGIGMVHQHFMLIDNFTVTQNMILGLEKTIFGGILDMKKARQNVIDIVQKYNLKVDPDAKIEDISVGMQQRVEILKALYRGVDTLILDEPTSVLTPQEIHELGIVLRNLVKLGKTIIIITHKLKEILDLADKCTIVRRGRYIDTVDVAKTNENELAEMMVGRSVDLVVAKEEAKPGNVVLDIENLSVKDKRGILQVDGLNLQVRKGEILGIAGIDGNGQKELVEAITCLRKSESGTIKINGEEIQNTRVKNVIDKKISIIHEDRQRRSLILNFTVSENMILETYSKAEFSKNGILKREKINEHAKTLINEYDIRPENCEDNPIVNLSGGNQQKAVIAREIYNDPDLLIAVQPTRGVDVGAIEYIHKTLIRERDKGKAILLVSYELDEVLNVSDTVAVIYGGKIIKTFKQSEANENTVGLLMAGGSDRK